jgi:signal peptidase II
MKIKGLLRTMFIMSVLCLNVGCDQVSKEFIRRNVDEDISFLRDHLTITNVENTGAFLSIGHSLPQPFKAIILTAVPLVALVFGFVFVFINKRLTNLALVGICFAIGGGFGNIVDRLLYGSVTDFLHIDFVIFQTGVFNMADVSIMTGMLILLFDSSQKTKAELNQ